jgi:hypothetical protein
VGEGRANEVVQDLTRAWQCRVDLER